MENSAVPPANSLAFDTDPFILSEKTEIRTPEKENTATKAGPARIWYSIPIPEYCHEHPFNLEHSICSLIVEQLSESEFVKDSLKKQDLSPK